MTYRRLICTCADKLPADNGKSQALNLGSSITAALHVERCAMVLHAWQLCILLVSRIGLVWKRAIQPGMLSVMKKSATLVFTLPAHDLQIQTLYRQSTCLAQDSSEPSCGAVLTFTCCC